MKILINILFWGWAVALVAVLLWCWVKHVKRPVDAEQNGDKSVDFPEEKN